MVFSDLAEAEFDRVVGVNLKGSFLVSQAVARQMVAQINPEHPSANRPPGTIINMSSVNAVFFPCGPCGLRDDQGRYSKPDKGDGGWRWRHMAFGSMPLVPGRSPAK